MVIKIRKMIYSYTKNSPEKEKIYILKANQLVAKL